MKKRNNILFLIVCIGSFFGYSQYTDVINSNRPGLSVSAYAVGKNVFQTEFGLSYEQQDHSLLATESKLIGVDFSLRYGLLFEELELNWEGTFQNQNITFINFGTDDSRTNFSRNRIGVKYLVYDPFKNPERNKPNIRSWRANHKFQLKNLLPAVSVYAGVNFVLGDNPFFQGDPTISPRVMIATQSKFTPRLVFISNVAYDRIGTDFPELSYLVSISQAFRNPKWSAFLENQGIKSDRYSDVLLRTGIAHLLNEKLQVDVNLGVSMKDTPSRLFASIGGSYRWDFHKDTLIPIEDQKAGENGGKIKRNAYKKKDGEKGLSKKEARRQRKAARKKAKKKKKQEEKEFIEF